MLNRRNPVAVKKGCANMTCELLETGWGGPEFSRINFGGEHLNAAQICLWHLCLCQVLALGMTFPLITCKVGVLQAAAQCFHYFFNQHCSFAFKNFTNKPQITALLCSKCGLWRPQFPHLPFTATAHHIIIA